MQTLSKKQRFKRNKAFWCVPLKEEGRTPPPPLLRLSLGYTRAAPLNYTAFYALVFLSLLVLGGRWTPLSFFFLLSRLGRFLPLFLFSLSSKLAPPFFYPPVFRFQPYIIR